MFLDAVILILQEILEAALLLSVLLAVNEQLGLHFAGTRKLTMHWYGISVITGIMGAALFAWAIPTVSEWFDYVGQEVVNALMHLMVIGCLYAHCLLLQPRARQIPGPDIGAGLALIVVITLSITREGAEIFLYLNGIMGTPTAVTPALLGTGLAGGIGVSAGILLYYSLTGFSSRVTLRIALVLLALFAGNMAAQSILLLTQADWMPYTPQLWDSSALLTEYSVTGQLLYALIGYEATPSLAQAIGYITAMLLLASTPLFRQSWQRNGERCCPMKATGRWAVTCCGILLAAANSAVADGLVVDKVYHPYVDALEKELEYRAVVQDTQPGRQNLAQVHQLSLGRAIGSRLFGEVYVVGAKNRASGFGVEAWEAELKWQLTEQGQYGIDWGVLFEYEDERRLDAHEFSLGLLAEKELGRFSATANFFVVNEWGKDVLDEVETVLSLQARYRGNAAFEPGVEFYAGQDSRGIGPVLQGNIVTGSRKSLHWEAGAIFGLGDKSPATTWRFQLEYEF